MTDNLEPFKELITDNNYSFFISIYGDMMGSSSSTGIYQLDENTAFVIKRYQKDHSVKEKIEQYKVSIDVYNEIFGLIKKNKLIKLVKAPKENYLAYDAAISEYQIRIGKKEYRFSSNQKIDQKRREVIWEILDLIHLKER
ncbi:MAG: hypothetical protein QM204_01650 [Bacillota bacterium]|nr:hypothetical protein [Bacillota bacterium]NLL26582.1 hypothetical protein [Erysipelotrichia bacterium]